MGLSATSRRATEIATEAIAKAMSFNVRAYGKLACEEDAEFFAACVIKDLEQHFRLEATDA